MSNVQTKKKETLCNINLFYMIAQICELNLQDELAIKYF
jgi:hypothetical protein